MLFDSFCGSGYHLQGIWKDFEGMGFAKFALQYTIGTNRFDCRHKSYWTNSLYRKLGYMMFIFVVEIVHPQLLKIALTMEQNMISFGFFSTKNGARNTALINRPRLRVAILIPTRYPASIGLSCNTIRTARFCCSASAPLYIYPEQ